MCYRFKKVRGDHKAVSDLIGYNSTEDPIPEEEEEPFVLEVNNKLKHNNIVCRVTNIDQSTNKATIDPVIPSDGGSTEIDLDSATSVSSQCHDELFAEDQQQQWQRCVGLLGPQCEGLAWFVDHSPPSAMQLGTLKSCDR